MEIRKAQTADLDAIMSIYEIARKYMREHGNKTQWVNGYPSRELLTEDMERGQLYVCEDKEKVVGVFAFILGEDATYLKIENGAWKSDESYGTIHRIASDGSVRGMSQKCYDFCREKISHLRADTHEDNYTMQQSLKKYGFEHCGTIYLPDGSPRLAYEWLLE